MGLFMNGFKRPRRVSDYYVPPFWGDGSDGILTAGTTYQAGVDFDKYSGFCIKQFSEIDWDPATAETLTVDEPCRGLILLVNGDVNIGANATISMAKKGSILPCNPKELLYLYHESKQIGHIVDTLLTLKGGAGGDGGNGRNEGANSLGGTGGVGRTCQGGRGGGGGGGATNTGGGNGGEVIYPEIPGYGGHSKPSNYVNSTTTPNGFNGGGGGHQHMRGGGGGYPFGAGGGGGSADWVEGGDYTGWDGYDGEHSGGFILIIASGSITITGTLDVTGGDGGNDGAYNLSSISYTGGGGGGGGGGVIALYAKGYIDTSSAVKTLTGGAGGSGYQSGTSGGTGTYYEERI